MTTIAAAHCQSCGSTSAEDVDNLSDTDGYTRCCNERVVYPRTDQRYDWRTGTYVDVGAPRCDPDDCFHVDDVMDFRADGARDIVVPVLGGTITYHVPAHVVDAVETERDRVYRAIRDRQRRTVR